MATYAVRHPLMALIAHRAAIGMVTLFIVSIVVFLATAVLPGNAAFARLGHAATPHSLQSIELQLHLHDGLIHRYWIWISGMFTGRLGNSFANGEPVWGQVAPRLVNSAVLVVIAGSIGSLLGVFGGAIAALRRDSWYDHLSSVANLVVTSLPEFIVAVILVILFATVVFPVLPAVSLLNPGTYAWDAPTLLVLPVATLVLVIVPYIFRMTRAAMIEAFESDYVEMARLKGVPEWRVVLVHALPNATGPTVQAIGLSFLYLAGGIVIVEDVFNYPGLGQGLVNAVSSRDVPTIQLIVVILAAFYVCVNILTDTIALAATPRRRIAR